MRSIFVSLLFAILSSSPELAIASPAALLATSCPPAAAMDPFVMMCGHNTFVALQAKFCAEALAESWNQAAQEIVPKIQARGKSGSQDVTEEDSGKNYSDAVKAITQQILVMQHYTRILEDYPRIMIDVPNSTDDETSLSCFNEAFHEVQNVVSLLDKEIIRAKKIRESTLALQNMANLRHRNFNASENPEAALQYEKVKISGLKNQRALSTITGEIQSQMNEIKTNGALIGKKDPSQKIAPFLVKPDLEGETASIVASFQMNLNKMDGQKNAPTKGKFHIPLPNSVGSIAWNDSDNRMFLKGDFEKILRSQQKSQKKTKFRVAALVGPDGTVKAFRPGREIFVEKRNTASTQLESAYNNNPGFRSDLAPSPGSSPMSIAHSVANSGIHEAVDEKTIFQIVSRRYRKHDLSRMKQEGARQISPGAPTQ